VCFQDQFQVEKKEVHWGGEFDFEVSVTPTLDFACFESIKFKKAYYVKWPKTDKH